ncbi:TetR/AcrR family transcriptional regulator C-terminal ligand-binding domain-containing protein [Mycobacteroides franklinii]|uniref:TetR/AcrR family transcriptional regulator C-terminal ligand-binding domain-containing protein n=1 Tax=Mycobacteroides franklinii TaxID=948102 RepID=UPI0013E8D6FA|nr:TetR family transcriptional regulator [Mycobacteroides franklinii]
MPKKPPGPPPAPVSRRRDDVLLSAIRDATWAELIDHGYSGVTFEGVARRAKTGKPVLYRRYGSRAQMVTDALPTLRIELVEVVPTESLRGDIMILVETIVETWQHIGIDTYRSLIAEADDATLQIFQARVAARADQTIRRALDAARERGEIGAATIPDLVATSIFALVRNELFFARRKIESNALAELVDSVYLPAIDAASRRSDK